MGVSGRKVQGQVKGDGTDPDGSGVQGDVPGGTSESAYCVGGENPGDILTGSITYAPDYESEKFPEGPKPKVFEPNHDRFKKSQRAEKKLAKELGGRAHPRSGGMAWSGNDKTTAQGDLTTQTLHIEHKRVEPQTASKGLKREWLKEVTQGAKRRMKIPAMVFLFEEAEGFEEEWFLLPKEFVERLLKLLEQDG